jgi:cellulose biosynthesis protein BcsQ
MEKRIPIVSLFNHKGGVSKTTTTFNLGWALADQGLKVMIVDGDPQCNLTGTVLGFSDVEDFENFYKTDPSSNISAGLVPVLQGFNKPLEPITLTLTPHENLFLLAGNIELARSETQIAVALSTSAAIPALQNIPGSIGAFLRIVAEHNNMDIILVDMSPAVGALNQCFLMASDFFIVPTSPDYYCNQAITSLATVIPEWNASIAQFRSKALVYPLPPNPPKFCGIISQRYRPRSGAPAKSFQQWIDKIKDTVDRELVPALGGCDMVISEADFRKSGAPDGPYNLANIPDFNSLIAQSQKFNRPVFALSDNEIEQAGVILETMRDSRNNFLTTFQSLAASIRSIASV